MVTLFQVGVGGVHESRSNALSIGYSGSTGTSGEDGTHYPFMIIPCEDSNGQDFTTSSLVGALKGTMMWDNDDKKLYVRAGGSWWSSSFGKVEQP